MKTISNLAVMLSIPLFIIACGCESVIGACIAALIATAGTMGSCRLEGKQNV